MKKVIISIALTIVVMILFIIYINNKSKYNPIVSVDGTPRWYSDHFKLNGYLSWNNANNKPDVQQAFLIKVSFYDKKLDCQIMDIIQYEFAILDWPKECEEVVLLDFDKKQAVIKHYDLIITVSGEKEGTSTWYSTRHNEGGMIVHSTDRSVFWWLF